MLTPKRTAKDMIDDSSCSDHEDVKRETKKQKKLSENPKPTTTTTFLDPPKFKRTRFLAKTPSDILQKLTQYGVAVVPNALPEESLKASEEKLWHSLEHTFPGFKQDDPNTWRTLRDNGAKHAMLLQTHGLGWSQGAIDVRHAPEIAQIFADLFTERAKLTSKGRAYAPHDMLSSSDGLSVYLNTPGSRGGFHRDGHNWLHWDRSPEDRTLSIQGFVNFFPTSEHGAAFEALLQSNHHQQEFARRFPSTKAKRFHILESQAQVLLLLFLSPMPVDTC
jgi:hypothetical protein